jgi:hypothetical protein
MIDGFRIEKLRRDHLVDSFTSGSPDLDRFLVRYAFGTQQANASQTWLGLSGPEVVGFHTLVVGEVAYADAPERLTKGIARHPVPIMLLARLAVSTSWQGRKLGAGLLKDAMRRTLQAADIAGIRVLRCTQKTMRHGGSTNISGLPHRRPTRCISICCSRTCGNSPRPDRLRRFHTNDDRTGRVAARRRAGPRTRTIPQDTRRQPYARSPKR